MANRKGKRYTIIKAEINQTNGIIRMIKERESDMDIMKMALCYGYAIISILLLKVNVRIILPMAILQELRCIRMTNWSV